MSRRANPGVYSTLRLIAVGGLTVAGLAAGCSSPKETENGVFMATGGGAGSDGGSSEVECAAGQVACNGVCVFLESDAMNCGACGVQCPTGATCEGDAGCVCLSNLTDCGTACVDTQSDASNCGGCGIACPAGQVCSLGQCATGCDPTLELCGTSCVDLTTNVSHCGSCDNVCTGGQICIGGSCACPNPGEELCAGRCVNTLTDPANCGGCGISCDGAACVSGTCESTGSGGSTTGSGGSTTGSGGSIVGSGGSTIGSGGSTIGSGGSIVGSGGAEGSGGWTMGFGGAEGSGGSTTGSGGAEGSGGEQVGSGGEQVGSGGAQGSGGTQDASCDSDEDCPNGYCDNGTCACWSANAMFCDGECVDVFWDNDNCGDCGHVCPPSEPSCSNGVCVCYSPPCDTTGSGGAATGSGGAQGSGGTVVGSGGTGVGGTQGSGGSGLGGSSGGPTLPDINGGQTGWASRYWDCCKPHCGWPGNAPNPLASCDQSGVSTLSDYDAQNGCEGGPAFMCYGYAPFSVSSTVSYGFAAFNSGNCGDCYHIQFDGNSHNGGADPGAAALSGKHMIVQVINIGGIEGGQFDLLIPGGGVGAMNGCSSQWGGADLGATYGGFLTSCAQSGDRASCVESMCQAAFGSATDLMNGCYWFTGWFSTADNPSLRYESIACPSEIRAISGMG